MADLAQSAVTRRRRSFPAVAVLVIGLAVTALGGFAGSQAVADRRDRRLESLALSARSAVSREIASYGETLVGLRSLFAADPRLTRVGFHDAVAQSDVFARFPGVRALSFHRALHPSDVAAFEAAVRNDQSLDDRGYPDFHVHPVLHDPVSDADPIFAIQYAEPTSEDQSVLGYDIAADPVHRDAAVEARDSGSLTASAPVDLIRGGRGFILALAVYDTALVPSTPPARRRHLAGLVVAAFDAPDMLADALGPRSGLDVRIYDVGRTVDAPGPLRGSELVYSSRPAPRRPSTSRRLALDLDVGSRRWRLLSAPLVPLESSGERALPLLIALAGALGSALLAGLVGSLSRSRRLALTVAGNATGDLVERERELHETNIALVGANLALAEADQAKTDFLAMISHELGTPLTSIRGFSDLLLTEEPGSDEARGYVQRILRNADAASLLITELGEFSRLERDEVSLTIRALPICALVEEVVEQLSTVLAGHRIVLELTGGVVALGDDQAVIRIVTNLLVNAAKYAPPATEVTVAVGDQDGRAVISVLDRGPGIREGEESRIFERFYRGTSPVATRASGTGIGLAVVRDLVTRMGGAVTATNRAGGGAAFVVTLPLAPPGVADGIPDGTDVGARRTGALEHAQGS